MAQIYTIDTNFFISGFGSTPTEYEILDKILRKNKIKILITNYVNKEMRWYMRRIIENYVKIHEIRESHLKKYCTKVAKSVDMSLPQLPDMSVVFLAEQEKVPIVSSDWRLVEVAQKLGLNAMMNSAFLVLLLEEIKDENDRKYLQNLYQRLFSEEITYSVQSQGRYDPVVRIQKIMDSALNVVRLQSADKGSEIEDSIEINHSFPEYHELLDVTKEVRTDISVYIQLMEEGNYKLLNFELNEAIARLTDLAIEVRMRDVSENDMVYRESLTTLAHILLLASTVAIGEQRLDEAESIIDQLLLIMLENDEVEKRLDIEVHLQRITLYFLKEQFSRLKIYFTPAFIELCKTRNRGDIIQLHRTMGIIIAVLSNKFIEKTATAKDFGEIQYIIQLGVQFIAVNKTESGWILLEQAIYMSLNSKIHGLLYAIFEVMLPFAFLEKLNRRSEISELLKLVKKKVKSLPFEDYSRRMKHNSKISDNVIRKRYTLFKNIPKNFQGFFDVINAEIVDFKKIGRSVFVRVIDWETLHIIGIIDPTLSLDENMTIGTSVKLHSGKFRIFRPSDNIKLNRHVDLIILSKVDDLKFIIRRSGQVTLAQSKVGEYDL